MARPQMRSRLRGASPPLSVTSVSSVGAQTLVDLLRTRAEAQPGRPAYAFLADGEVESGRWTWAEVDERARRIGAALRQAAAPGDRALLLYPQGLEFVAAFYGCLYGGLAAVPAYPPRNERGLPRLLAITGDARPTVILTTAAVRDEVRPWLDGVAGTAGVTWIATDELDPALADAWTRPNVDGSTLAFLQYTSGSTATPKGVMVSHANLLHNLKLLQEGWGQSAESVVVSWLPLFHDMGLIGIVLESLHLGAPCVLMAPAAFLQKPFRWLDAVSRYGATLSGGPNFAFDLCVQRIAPEQREGLDLGRWSAAFNGAEPVRRDTLERFYQAFAPCGLRREALQPGYGLAEGTLVVSAGRVADTPPLVEPFDAAGLEANRLVMADPAAGDARWLVGCGRVVGDQRVAIADPDTGTACPPGIVGEIWVMGPSVAGGYWERPEETERTFAARLAGTGEGPFLRTGDLGFVHGGELFVTGRARDLIIIRGRNLYPQDVELSAERSHAGVRAGCTAAFAVEIGGEERLVMAAEVDRHHLRGDLPAIASAIRRAIVDDHEVAPAAVVLLRTGTIPKTTSGKIQRRACRAGWLDGSLEMVHAWIEAAPASTSPETATAASGDGTIALSPSPETTTASGDGTAAGVRALEAWLVAKVAARAGIDAREVDRREPFAVYGLDSVAATAISGELEELLDRPVSPTALYEHPSIGRLARFLAGAPELQGTGDRGQGTAGNGNRTGDGIAIVGMGCRFPGADGPAAFWRLLRDGVDAVREVPADRWDVEALYDPDPRAPGKMSTRWGGFLERIDGFDAGFFSISPREAMRMDPQQRLLLEVAWEALEDAGIDPDALAGSSTGVFVGISASDYGQLQFADPGLSDAYAGTGGALSIAANRLSYVLDLRGPSMAIDTACSSSLVALHLACRALADGECAAAIVGGVNLLLQAGVTVNFSKAGFMSPDGRCRAFDAGANGYVRGEGAGVVVLKPLAAALADGDAIHAVISGSAVNQDGRSNGLTAPSRAAQEAVVREACRRAGVRPGRLQYVEAHGTGTPLGDPIEAAALGAVLGDGRAEGGRCAIGSVKSNIGHLEAAAGIAGVIKVALALRHRELPGSLHLHRPNPEIAWGALPIAVQATTSPWPGDPGDGLAGVSSFGFGGTNAHVVLAEAPSPSRRTDAVVASPGVNAAVRVASPGVNAAVRVASPGADAATEGTEVLPLSAGSPDMLVAASAPESQAAAVALTSGDARAVLVPISARSPEALAALAERWRAHLGLEGAGADLPLRDLAHAAALRRAHHDHRLTLAAGSREELRERLADAAAGDAHPRLGRGRAGMQGPPRIAFVFSGQGPQWWGMGRELRANEPAFAAAVAACDRRLRDIAGWSLADELAKDAESSRLRETEVAQPALFALQMGLVALWRSRGIIPDAVVGHSVGEIAAACVSGAIDLGDAIRIVHHRGRLMQQATGLGSMAAVGLSLDEAEAMVAPFGARLSVAAHNGPRSTVLSGETAALEEVLAGLEAREVFVRRMGVDYAFHSAQMQPYADELGEALEGIVPRAASVPFVSTVAGGVLPGDALGAGYWSGNVRQPVRFAEAVGALVEMGIDAFVEVGPHPVLGQSIAQCLADATESGRLSPVTCPLSPAVPSPVVLPSLRREENERATMLASLGALYVRGAPVDWRALYGAIAPAIPLPTYPWQRERYWLEPAAAPRRIDVSALALHPADAFRRGADEAAPAPVPADPRAEILAAEPGARFAMIETYLRAAAGQVLRIAPARLDLDLPVTRQGLDSLVAVELRNRVERELGVQLPLKTLLGGAGIAELAVSVAGQLADVPVERVASPESLDGFGGYVGELAATTTHSPPSRTSTAPGDAAHPSLVGMASPESSAADGSLSQHERIVSPEILTGDAPLSHGERALWMLHQLYPQSAASNVMVALRLGDAVDVAALRRAFAALVHRHAALRTAYPARDGRPVRAVQGTGDRGQLQGTGDRGQGTAIELQEMADRGSESDRVGDGLFGWAEIDASAWSAAELDERLAADAHRPFDLERGPLLRLAVYTRGDGGRVLLWAMHHATTDFWSNVLLLDDLTALYAHETGDAVRRVDRSEGNDERRAGDDATLPPAAGATYADFARWQREMLAGPRGEALWRFWRDELAGLPVLALPTDRPRPAVPGFRGGAVPLRLGMELSARLKAFAEARGTTPYVALLAAFQALLHRYAGDDDVAVASPMAGRGQAGFERTVGYFMNLVMVRGDLSGRPSYHALVERLRGRVLGALEHQDYPLDLLAERLGRAGQSPLFQAMFVLNRPHRMQDDGIAGVMLGEPGARFERGGLAMESHPLEERISFCDLALWLGESRGELAGRLQYDTDLFDAPTIARMADSFAVLLDAALGAPDSPLAALPLLSAEERNQVEAWAMGPIAPREPLSVHAMLQAQARRTPDAIALAGDGEAVTYAELNARANRLAHHLRALGVGTDVPVGVCLERSVDAIVAIFGILEAGGAYLPLDPAHPAERLEYVTGDARAPVIITRRALAKRLDGTAATLVRVDADRAEIDASPDADPPSVDPRQAGARSAQAAEAPPADAHGEAAAYVIYTSGSTGAPKGTVVRHAALSNHTRAAIDDYAITPADRVLQFASLAFDASAEEIFPTLATGATLVLRPGGALGSIADFFTFCREAGITVLDLPTAYWHQVAQAMEMDGLALPPAVRLVIIGGERALPERVRAWAARAGEGVRLVNSYGPTEATIVATRHELSSGTDTAREIPIGRPIRNLAARVLDAEMNPVPIGVPGQLLLGGAGLARGYLGRPALTAEHFIPDPFAAEPGARLYATGDLARLRSDGELEFAGRMDSQVKVRGYRVEPGEVEAALARHPEVLHAAVVAREDMPGDRRLVAYLQPRRAPGPPVREVKEFLRELLPEYMLPSSIVVLDAMPMTPTGKVDRRALPAPHAAEAAPADPAASPSTPSETLLAEIWAQVLGRERVGVHDAFLELGGDSILAIQVVTRAHRAGLRLTPLQLFQHHTIASLAAALDAEAAAV